MSKYSLTKDKKMGVVKNTVYDPYGHAVYVLYLDGKDDRDVFFFVSDVQRALKGLKKDVCKEMLPRWMIVDLIDKWFPVFKEEEEKKP